MVGKVGYFYVQLGARIRELRRKFGLTQAELAKQLNVSRATVTQIEKGDRKICTEEAVRLSEIFHIQLNALVDPGKEIEVVLEEAERKSDMQRIRINVPQRNTAKFKEVLLYILDRVGSRPNIGETVLYKLLYFIDFDFYEIYEEQLIGAAYIKNTYGPTPVEFAKIVDVMIEHGEIEKAKRDYHGYPQTRYLPLREPDLSVLGAHEIKLIDKVLSRLSDMNAMQISEYSHGDIPWMVTDDNDNIEYESVFYRTPQYSVRRYDGDV